MALNRRQTLALLGSGVGAASAGAAEARVGGVAFLHGVASGDPLQDRLIIWTRVTPSGDLATGVAAGVAWMVAEDPALTRIVARGQAMTGPERDYTVKVDVGGLSPGRDY